MPCTWTGGSRRMLSAILFSPTSEFWPPLLFVWGVYKISFGFRQKCLRLKTLLISAAAGHRNWAAAGSSTDDSWRPLWSLLASLSVLELLQHKHTLIVIKNISSDTHTRGHNWQSWQNTDWNCKRQAKSFENLCWWLNFPFLDTNGHQISQYYWNFISPNYLITGS